MPVSDAQPFSTPEVAAATANAAQELKEQAADGAAGASPVAEGKGKARKGPYPETQLVIAPPALPACSFDNTKRG